jgi:predicted alpha/beta hydrolase family esterase
MKLILLAGNSIENKAWIRNIEGGMSHLFDSTHVLEYGHWNDGSKMIDFDKESKRLSEVINDDEDKFVIFAKSAGCLVALKAIYENKIDPSRCMFVGFPLGMAEESGLKIKDWLESYNEPIVFIQKENDPKGSVEKLEDYLNKTQTNDYEVIQMDGDDHRYEEIEDLVALMEVFVADEE